MTTPVTGQPRYPLIRWAIAPVRVFRYLNQELLAAGEDPGTSGIKPVGVVNGANQMLVIFPLTRH
jgi:hypothetical protein